MKKYKLTYFDKDDNELKIEIIYAINYSDAMNTRVEKIANSMMNDLKYILINKI